MSLKKKTTRTGKSTGGDPTDPEVFDKDDFYPGFWQKDGSSSRPVSWHRKQNARIWVEASPNAVMKHVHYLLVEILDELRKK